MEFSMNEVSASLNDDMMEEIEKMLDEKRSLKSRIKDLEDELSRKINEVEIITEKYREKQWRHFEYHSPGSGLEPTSELAAHLILSLRAEVSGLKAMYEDAEAKRKEEEDMASSCMEEYSYLRAALQDSKMEAELDELKVPVLNELLTIRKKTLDGCRKRVDRIRSELHLLHRALERVLTEPEMRERIILMLSAGKSNLQKVLDLNLQVDELQQKVKELEDQLEESHIAREATESLRAPRKSTNKRILVQSNALKPRGPTEEEVKAQLMRLNKEKQALEEELDNVLGDKDVLKESILELTNRNQQFKQQLEIHHELLKEVESRLTQSETEWRRKLSELRRSRQEAQHQLQEVIDLMNKERERCKNCEAQLSAQEDIITSLQKYAVPGDAQLLQGSGVWRPYCVKTSQEPQYYCSLLAAARIERDRLISLVRTMSERAEVDRRGAADFRDKLKVQQRRAAALQQRIEVAEAAASRQTQMRHVCSALCYAKHEPEVEQLRQECASLRVLSEQMRTQNAADMQAYVKMLHHQQQLFTEAIHRAEVTKDRTCLDSYTSTSQARPTVSSPPCRDQGMNIPC